MASSTGTILITGGTGKVGSCLANLCKSSSTPYLIASRSSPSTTSSAGHSAVKFDWLDQTTWSNPFTTITTSSSSNSPITAVFLVAPPIADSSPVLNEFIDLARTQHGVKRFVLLSATVIEAGGPAYGGTARYLQELGGARGEVEFGIMRPTWFMDNWAEHDNIRKPVRDEGTAYSAAGDGKVPWVSKVDIAACAFRALTAERAPGGDCIILGPELLSYGDCADILSEVTGKKIVHVSVTAEQLAERHMRISGLPENYAKVLASTDTLIKNGSEARLNDVVLSVTGKNPRSFREFAQENRDVWL
ncbi:hypothetical protein VMCG_03375 [Cytospora schulzeri]|uniref:NAD(P)-binding domain-containing protein n=1 Tax=Cytospora schulzeri TaxID=448051 RepID=A0A423WWG8_9PEZI|nr:hypothetical protein VMCG_03375 [Valsa malicola]